MADRGMAPEQEQEATGWPSGTTDVAQALRTANAASTETLVWEELGAWWAAQARTEASRVLPKAREYGSDDLLRIGRDLAELMGREVADDEAAELGIYFYLVGKMARWSAAVREGRRVDVDTPFDIGIYCRMVQRIRETGGWPGEAVTPAHFYEEGIES